MCSRSTATPPPRSAFFFYRYGDPRDLHSFPTRRSSDLIPGFPLSTVESHAGELLVGTLAGRRVAAMRGRFHCYEGYTPQQIGLPVRVLERLGARTLMRSEEHTSELQSHHDLVCRLLLEK